MDSIAIELKNLRFSYLSPKNESPWLIDIPELKIKKGETVFIYGPSGGGKTSFLEILSGILQPQGGSVKVGGTDLVNLSAAQRDDFRAQNMAFVFQSFNLIPYLSVEENILLPLALRGKKDISDEKLRLPSLVERLGLTSLLSKSIAQLSVGQQQRVAVARALLGRPQILLADEPTSSLDFDNRERFLKLMFDIAQESQSTIVFVSHDRSLERMFDRSLSFVELNRARSVDILEGGV